MFSVLETGMEAEMECGSQGSADAAGLRLIVWPPYGNGPYWPFPQLSIGDLHGILMRGLLKFYDGRRSGDTSLRTAVAELATTGAAGREEIGFLNRLVKITDGEAGPRMLASMRDLQAELVTSIRPTPIAALAIVSIGIDSLGSELSEGGAARKWFREDLECGALGATIGGAIGGPGGAAIGALAAGIAGSCLARQAKEG